MDFEKRLQKAVERGHLRGDVKAREAREKRLSAEELKNIHSQLRLQLSEHIEHCLENLPNHFPGFRFETIYGDRGWGACCSRDDAGRGRDGKRTDYFSRLEMAIRPYSSSLNVLELVAKGTIRNKEVYNRKYFEKLDEVDTDTFRELIDVWVLEYAELYAART